MNVLIIDNTSEPNNAATKPVTLKPGTNLATNRNIKALIIKVNNPKVRKFIGRVKRKNTGLIKTLTRPITNAAHKAAEKPAKLIPGTSHATKSNASARSTHLIIIANIIFLLIFS